MLQYALLLSIHPKHANNIFGGTKTIELRRVRPKISSGDLVIVYVSAPIKAVAGAFEVGGIVEDSPRNLWDNVKNIAAITQAQFDKYYENAERAYGIMISKAWRLNHTITLKKLRQMLPGFHPPQGYRYLKDVDLQRAGVFV